MLLKPTRFFEKTLSLLNAEDLDKNHRYNRQRDEKPDHTKKMYEAVVSDDALFLPYQSPLVIVKNTITNEYWLVDGQHRTKMQIDKGIETMDYFVHEYDVTSVEEVTAIACAIDKNKKRTPSDLLNFHGWGEILKEEKLTKTQGSSIAKAVGVIMKGMDVGTNNKSVIAQFPEETVEVSWDHIDVAKIIFKIFGNKKIFKSKIKKALLTAGIFGPLLFILKNHRDKTVAEAFVKTIAWETTDSIEWRDGLKYYSTYKTSPGKVIEKFLESDPTKSTTAKIATYNRLICIAWNHFVQHEAMTEYTAPQENAASDPVIYHGLGEFQKKHDCLNIVPGVLKNAGAIDGVDSDSRLEEYIKSRQVVVV